jgi:DNA repair protein RecN (Recombination protein N)
VKPRYNRHSVLIELMAENYAVVERLRVRFHHGLNLLTGETGSGKSLVVDALSLLLGERASSDVIRTGEARARIAAIFDVRAHSQVQEILATAGLETEDGDLLVEREILAGGKSRAFVGSRPVSLALLKDLAPHLADIHGQHDQQLLFSPDAQRGMLDAFAGNGELADRIAAIYAEWRAAGAELEQLERSEQERLRLVDLWSFQRKEIEGASLALDEETSLENERRVLQNLSRIQEGAASAYAAVYDSPESALSLARAAVRRVDDLCRLDSTLEGVRENLRAADLSLQEAAYALRDYLAGLEANPGRLDEIESRLAVIGRLKRKYGQTVSDVLAFLEDVRRQLAAIEHAGERIEELRQRRADLAMDFASSSAELTAQRKSASRRLEKRVEAELASLAMERTVFRIAIQPAEWSEHGADSVEFLVSPNVGEEPRPLQKVASGGEISRIALAIKTCLTASKRSVGDGPIRTLVFDEVDAGIGGSAAEGVGRRLKKLATANQVLCVTHLAQIASFADHHYRVEKRESKGRTVALVEELEADARTREIGRMLSGQKLTEEALKHAEQLIKMSVA